MHIKLRIKVLQKQKNAIHSVIDGKDGAFLCSKFSDELTLFAQELER